MRWSAVAIFGALALAGCKEATPTVVVQPAPVIVKPEVIVAPRAMPVHLSKREKRAIKQSQRRLQQLHDELQDMPPPPRSPSH